MGQGTNEVSARITDRVLSSYMYKLGGVSSSSMRNCMSSTLQHLTKELKRRCTRVCELFFDNQRPPASFILFHKLSCCCALLLLGPSISPPLPIFTWLLVLQSRHVASTAATRLVQNGNETKLAQEQLGPCYLCNLWALGDP